MKKYIVIISENKDIMGGAPCIDGTRLPIAMLKKGLAQFKRYYPLMKKTGKWWMQSVFELK